MAALLALTAPAPPPAPQLSGVWRNPYDTLEVRTGPCGMDVCGWVVWAAPAAIADARYDGDDALLGQLLLHGFRPDGAGAWRGGVTLPGHPVSIRATLTVFDGVRLREHGCLLSGLLCRTQIWRHVGS